VRIFKNLLFDFNPLALKSIRLLSNNSCCIESSNLFLPISAFRFGFFFGLILVFYFVSFVRILRSNLSFEPFVRILRLFVDFFLSTKSLLATESLPVGVISLLLFESLVVRNPRSFDVRRMNLSSFYEFFFKFVDFDALNGAMESLPVGVIYQRAIALYILFCRVLSLICFYSCRSVSFDPSFRLFLIRLPVRKI